MRDSWYTLAVLATSLLLLVVLPLSGCASDESTAANEDYVNHLNETATADRARKECSKLSWTKLAREYGVHSRVSAAMKYAEINFDASVQSDAYFACLKELQ